VINYEIAVAGRYCLLWLPLTIWFMTRIREEEDCRLPNILDGGGWDLRTNPTTRSCVFITKVRTNLHSFQQTLHTYTAAPRLTQPSTLCGTVKWLSLLSRLSNTIWRWYVTTAAHTSRRNSVGLVWP